jgi:hypothetical protein
LRANQPLPNDPGNAFVGDSDRGHVKTGPRAELDVRAYWTGEKSLLITYPQGTQLFRSDNRIGEVSVDYRATRNPGE